MTTSFDPLTHPSWRHYERWHTACAQGRCLYDDPQRPALPATKRPAHRPRDDDACPGYHGSVTLEEGRLVARSRLCARHRAWWTAERSRIQQRHQQDVRATGKKPGGSWAEGE